MMLENSPKEIKIIKNVYGHFRKMYGETSNTYKDQTNVCIADVSRSLESEKGRVYSDEKAHLNAKGNAIVAQSLRDELVKCGILELLPAQNPS